VDEIKMAQESTSIDFGECINDGHFVFIHLRGHIGMGQ